MRPVLFPSPFVGTWKKKEKKKEKVLSGKGCLSAKGGGRARASWDSASQVNKESPGWNTNKNKQLRVFRYFPNEAPQLLGSDLTEP